MLWKNLSKYIRRDRLSTPVSWGFPCGSAGKESTCTAGDWGLILGLGISPGEGKSYPLQYSGLENSVNSIVRGITKSRTWLLLLLLLLSPFSRVQLCATPQTAAHQAPPSLGFSRQEHWSGLPFPSPIHEREKWKWGRSVIPNPSDPMDCSLPGSSVHGIFQARVLEWIAIPFSRTCLRDV